MRVLLCKLCEYVCKLENGRHNLVGIFDDVRTDKLPIEHPPFFIACHIEFEGDDIGRQIQLSVRLVGPDNREVLKSELNAQVPHQVGSDTVRFFFYAPIQGVTLSQTGVHRIMVSVQGDILHSETIPVFIVQPPPMGLN